MGIGALLLSGLTPTEAANLIHKPQDIHLSPRDLDALIRVVWGEAGGEIDTARKAVAHVVFNRVRSDRRLFVKDTSVWRACDRLGQFSSWFHDWHLRKSAPVYDEIKQNVHDAVISYRAGIDYSNGATHFETKDARAMWSRGHKPCARVGHLDFYNLIERR